MRATTGLVAGPAHSGKRGRRFVLPSAKRNNRTGLEEGAKTNGHVKDESKVNPKMVPGPSPAAPGTNAPGNPLDLTETIKALLHLSQEHGYVTYDDINDVLPDGLDPDDLDEVMQRRGHSGAAADQIRGPEATRADLDQSCDQRDDGERGDRLAIARVDS